MKNRLLVTVILLFVNQIQISFCIKIPPKIRKLNHTSSSFRSHAERYILSVPKKKKINFKIRKIKHWHPNLAKNNFIAKLKKFDKTKTTDNFIDSDGDSETEEYSSGSYTDSFDSTKAICNYDGMEELNEPDYSHDCTDSDDNYHSSSPISKDLALLEQKFQQISVELQHQKQQQHPQRINRHLNYFPYYSKNWSSLCDWILISQGLSPHPTMPHP